MPFRYARAAARPGPSVRARLRCLRSNRRRGHRGASARGALRRHHGAALPSSRGAARAPAPTGPGARGRGGPACGSICRPGRCMFALVDEAPLVAGQRHPLRQHVVGVRQQRAAVRPRLVGELHAVLGEQRAGLRQVGDDRLVRVHEVGVRRASAARPGCPGPSASRPQTRRKPRSRYIAHSSSFTHERSSGAGALLGAALAAGVHAGPGTIRRRARRRSFQRSMCGMATSHSSTTMTIAVALRASSTIAPTCPPAARGKKITRSASRGTSSKDRTSCASRRPPPAVAGTAAHMPASSWRAELLDERVAAPRAPRRPPRRSAPRRAPASCAATSSADYDKADSPAGQLLAPSTKVLRSGHFRSSRAALREADDVDGTCSRAEFAQAVAHRGGGRRARPPGCLGQRVARARDAPRASRSACSPSRAPRRRGGARRGAP